MVSHTNAPTASPGDGDRFLALGIKILPVLQVILLLIALDQLGFGGKGFWGWFKLLIFGGAAFLVAHAIYQLAIVKAAGLFVRGRVWAAVLGGVTVLIVGIAFLITTYGGLVNGEVEQRRQAAFLHEVGIYVDGRIAVADQAAELVPIMQALAQDLSARSEQECRSGGCGPIARVLQALFGRADGLSTQMTVSIAVRQEALDQIAALRRDMEEVLADEERDISDRRAELSSQFSELLGLLVELDKAIPVSLVRSYATELQSGILIPNREDASAQINRTLAGFSASLTEALAEQKGVAGEPPAFPEKTGAMDTLAHAADFAPILLLAVVIDLIFPLSLLLYTIGVLSELTITGGGDFMKRPGMVALLSFLDAQPDENFVVIFDDLKRFARDTRFHLDLRDAFRKRDARIECLNFKFDETPEGEFIETIMAAQGALERKQNGRQVAQKMKARMQNGYWIHNPPVGYRYQTIKGHGKLLIRNEPLASVIKDGFEGYASGRFQTQAEVKRFFETHPDFPRNKHGEVKQQRVTDILTQPIYAGYICSETYGINWLKAQHESLISLETFDKVQKRRQSVAHAPARKNIGDDFALRGFVCCGDCEKPLRSSWSKGKYKSYAYYLCQTKGCASYGKSIPRDKLEGDFAGIVKTLQPSKPLFTLARMMFRDIWDHRLAKADEAVQSLKQHLRQSDKQIEGLLDRILNASSDAVIRTYEQKITELESSKVRLHDQLANQQPSKGKFEEVLELSLKFLANPWKLWESGEIALQRMVLRLAFTDRLIYHRNEGARTPKTALPFKALGGISTRLVESGASRGTRTPDLVLTKDLLYQLSY